MYQICHDDGVYNDRLWGSSQGELEPTWRLAWADVKAVAFQQEMLQFVLGCHNILHLQTPDMSGQVKFTSLLTAAPGQTQ